MSNKLELKILLSAIERVTAPLKRVSTASKQTSAEVKALRDKMGALNRTASQIDGYRKTAEQTAKTAVALKEVQTRARSLAAQLKATTSPTRELQQSFAEAKRQAAGLATQSNELNQKLQRQRAALKEAGIDTRKLASHQRELRADSSRTSEALRQQEARLKAINERMRQVNAARARYQSGMATRDKLAGAGAGMLVGGAAAGAAVAAPVRAFAEAEDASTQLRVAMMGKNGQIGADFARITALADRLGNRLPGTTADFQNMMTMLIRQGMSAKVILGGLGEATAYLGVQLKMPMDQAAEFAAKLQDATKTTERDMMGLMDTIQRTFYLGVDQNNMLQAFAKLSPAMDTIKQKGLEGARALAPLVVMADQAGMAGEAAGNAYRKVFQMGMNASKVAKANADLASQGIRLDFTNGKGEFGGLNNLFVQLDKLKALSTQNRLSVIKQLFGDDAETLQVVSLLIEKGADGYKDVQQKMANQADLQRRVNLQLGTLKNLWDAASGTFTNALVRFGEAIAPELKALTIWIAEVSEGLGNWAKTHPTLSNALMKFIAIAAVVLTVLGALTLALATVMGPMLMVRTGFAMLGIQLGGGVGVFGMISGMLARFGTALSLVGTVIGWVGTVLRVVFAFLLANPIIAVIALIVAAAIYIWQNWDTLGPKFKALWEGIKHFASAAWESIKSTVIAVGRGIADFFINWSLPGLIYKHWDAIMAFFDALPSKFVQFGLNIMQGMVNGITNGLSGVKDAITNAGASSINWFKEKLGIHSPSRVFAALGGFTMAGLAQGLNEGQDGPLSAIHTLVKGLSAPLAAGLALSSSVISSAGPIAIDSRPSLPAAGPASASAMAPITINVYAAPGMDAAALAKAVAVELEKQQRQVAVRSRARLSDHD